jgi:hypothetical protein
MDGWSATRARSPNSSASAKRGWPRRVRMVARDGSSKSAGGSSRKPGGSNLGGRLGLSSARGADWRLWPGTRRSWKKGPGESCSGSRVTLRVLFVNQEPDSSTSARGAGVAGVADAGVKVGIGAPPCARGVPCGGDIVLAWAGLPGTGVAGAALTVASGAGPGDCGVKLGSGDTGIAGREVLAVSGVRPCGCGVKLGDCPVEPGDRAAAGCAAAGCAVGAGAAKGGAAKGCGEGGKPRDWAEAG